MNNLVFNFQNMMDMHKGYAYQNFNFITYQKKIISVQPSMNKIQNKVTCEKIEPQFYEELPNCSTSFVP
jgi:hypothetical protein